MSLFLQQLLLLVLIAILQRSFLDILWPDFIAPSLIIAAIIAQVFVLGFVKGISWVLALVFLYALLGADGSIGYFPVAAIAIAYGASFLSRRLLIERPVQSSLALALVSAASTSVYGLLLQLLQDSSVAVSTSLGNALLAAVVFPMVFITLRSQNEHVRSSLMSEFRGLRA